MACDYEQGDPFHSDLIPRAHTGKCVSYNTRHLKSEERIWKNEGERTEVEIRMRKNIPDSGGSVGSYFPLRRDMLNIYQKEPVKVTTKRMETYKLKSPLRPTKKNNNNFFPWGAGGGGGAEGEGRIHY